MNKVSRRPGQGPTVNCAATCRSPGLTRHDTPPTPLLANALPHELAGPACQGSGRALPMSRRVTPGHSGPRTRTLLWLALLVLLVHGLVLRTEPTHFGPTLTPAAQRTAAFATRSIPAAPPAAAVTAAAAPATVAAKPRPQRAKKPILKPKPPETPVLQAPAAIDSIVSPALNTLPPEPPAADASSDQAATLAAQDGAPPEASNTAETSDAAVAAPPAVAASASAASAPAAELPAPPPGMRQTLATTVKLPDSARLAYKVTGNAKGLTYHASAELNWRNALSHYDASMTVSALFIGSRTLSSSGQIGGEGLAPTRFADKYKSEVAAHFEPDKGQVSFSANTPAVPWLQGMQDRVSVFFQLAGMLAGTPEKFPVGSVISMVTVGPRDADGWSFVVEAAEKISLPAGDLDTLKLARQPRKEFDQKVEIWYAPSLGYLPVRSKITQANGDFVDQQLQSVNPPAP